MDPTSLEQAYWWSQIFLAGVAFGGAVFAGWQLWFIRLSHKHTLEQAKARFLFDLDQRWSGERMAMTRMAINELCIAVRADVGREHHHLNEDGRRLRCQEVFSIRLNETRQTDLPLYVTYMRSCSFFETVGLMVKKGFVSEKTIMDLFLGPIVDLDEVFSLHIEQRAKEMGVPPGLFENALHLAERAKRRGAVK